MDFSDSSGSQPVPTNRTNTLQREGILPSTSGTIPGSKHGKATGLKF